MKRILIIGATSAIAVACARQWAPQGASFFLVGRHAEKLEQTVADLVARGAAAVNSRVMDAADVDTLPGMLTTCQAALGRIDIALIAYGTLPDQQACEMNLTLALQEFANNSTSVIAILTLLANLMESQGSGVLAVITSVAGERGRRTNYLYGSAKSAVSIFCQGMRGRLFRKGIYLVDIRPGFVATPMTERLALPGLLVTQPDVVAKRIVAGLERKVAVLYAPAFWAAIMLLIRMVPEIVWKRITL